MQWKDAKLVKVVIKSTLGGNLRLRVPNAMKVSTGGPLKKATGENTNPFYQTEKTAAPIVSAKASITSPELKKTLMYDLPTQGGKVYTFIAQ
jgi:alpha-L-fucosidase 2